MSTPISNQSQVEPECCHGLARCAHTGDSAETLGPCYPGPLQALDTKEHRREACGGLRTAQALATGTPWHLQSGYYEWQKEADRFLSKREWVLSEAHLQVREGLKSGGLAASPTIQSENF